MASSLRVSHHNSRQASVGNLNSLLGVGSSNSSNGSTRPVSEIFPPNHMQQNDDHMGQAARMWIDKIEEFEATLNEMAAAALDSDFKKELAAIEQWFRVLSEAERTAALYALLQQTTQVQIRFFIQVLQQMGQQHPVSGILSPSGFGDKDPMFQQLGDAFSRLAVDPNRGPQTSVPPPSPSVKRAPTLDSSTISSMFPDAAAVVAQQKAVRSQASIPTSSQPNIRDMPSLADGPLSPQPLRSSTTTPYGVNRPRSSLGLSVRSPQPSLNVNSLASGFSLNNNPPPPSAGLMSSRPAIPPHFTQQLPHKSGSWASMTNTPITATFPSISSVQQTTAVPATNSAFKPIALQPPPKGRFGARTQSPVATQPLGQMMMNNPSLLPNNHHLAELQLNTVNSLAGNPSLPTSPSVFTGPFDSLRASNLMGSLIQSPTPLSPLPSIQLQQPGYIPAPLLSPGILSDSGDGMGTIGKRSNNGRRGNSKPPEDPTDPALLNDVPAWLRSLRLHKYTENLQDYTWQELVAMDDNALEKRGVNALGARRKMLKAFEQVREAQAAGRI